MKIKQFALAAVASVGLVAACGAMTIGMDAAYAASQESFRWLGIDRNKVFATSVAKIGNCQLVRVVDADIPGDQGVRVVYMGISTAGPNVSCPVAVSEPATVRVR